ncbi:hypothetical protein LUZ62_065330 [Rhynchospora pubera]|uniref:Nucleolar complex protein 2 n=1 Tax=Rhynchospora pubera TaxID=906938 RepID=A0AAV8ERB8_9POAL|nr:hypothetical protein LUZ62_065330 [Rhynchospora pubera]
MAKKLGKKARKFARKGLQTVQKQKRKQRTFFKKKSAPRGRGLNGEAPDENEENLNHERNVSQLDQNVGGGHVFDKNIGNLLGEEDEVELEDDFSDSDGYLSEDTECPYISENENENISRDDTARGTFQEENTEIKMQIAKQKKELDKLLAKDKEFAKFLESRRSQLEQYDRMVSDDEEVEGDEEEEEEEEQEEQTRQPVTQTTLDVWCWLVTEDPNSPALRNLLNLYHNASLFGVITSRNEKSAQIVSHEVYSTVINFVLCEADGIFRALLGVAENSNAERILMKLKSSKEWLNVGPLVKSYFKSSIKLLNQVTDTMLLVFLLFRLMSSVVFLHAFSSLGRRLIKILVRFWSTGEDQLSTSAFLLMKEVASQLSSDYFNICMKAMYRTFVARCKFVDDSNLARIDFMKSSFLEITSLDVQQSYLVAVSSLQRLGDVVKHSSTTKKKEDLMKINNWQYINCLNLWVKFICLNYKENNLQQLFDKAVRVIFGVTSLFTGPRFLPLKLKCAQMLNDLSLTSGHFIPVSSLVFECLDLTGVVTGKMDGDEEPRLKLSTLLKVPGNLLKSRRFQEECVRSSVEVLCTHFSQWSFHVSLPELSTIPLILLKRCHEKATVESVRRLIKRFIDQAEQNRDFLQMKRDGVSFSPNDQTSIDNFLLLEKSNVKSSFTQFYASMLQNSQIRNMVK